MDKRTLSELFRERLRLLLAADDQSTVQFLRDTGIDRSALSQFLDPAHVRLPRAEALRNIAVARGVSVDWLLGMENAPEGRQSLSSSLHVEHAMGGDRSQLEKWRAEVAGQKLRYVPSLLPDMLNLELQDDAAVGEGEVRGSNTENVLAGQMPGDMDIEICMPIQTLHNLAEQRGHWKGIEPELCRQLTHMATICEATYPTLRLHVFDGRRNHSTSFTVFGKNRVAIYVGEAYLVLTGQDEIRGFVSRFDNLVRQATVSPDQTSAILTSLAKQI